MTRGVILQFPDSGIELTSVYGHYLLVENHHTHSMGRGGRLQRDDKNHRKLRGGRQTDNTSIRRKRPSLHLTSGKGAHSAGDSAVWTGGGTGTCLSFACMRASVRYRVSGFVSYHIIYRRSSTSRFPKVKKVSSLERARAFAFRPGVASSLS